MSTVTSVITSVPLADSSGVIASAHFTEDGHVIPTPPFVTTSVSVRQVVVLAPAVSVTVTVAVAVNVIIFPEAPLIDTAPDTLPSA